MEQLALFGESYQAELSAFFFDRPIRAFPETFDRRSARVRASLLVQIITGCPRDPKDGSVFDGSAVFADSETRDLPYFFPNQRRPKVSNPANRVILPRGYPRNVKQVFSVLDSKNRGEFQVLSPHFIDHEAAQALRSDDFERFIERRERNILNAEQSFLNLYGLTINTVAQRSDEEIDVDE